MDKFKSELEQVKKSDQSRWVEFFNCSLINIMDDYVVGKLIKFPTKQPFFSLEYWIFEGSERLCDDDFISCHYCPAQGDIKIATTRCLKSLRKNLKENK